MSPLDAQQEVIHSLTSLLSVETGEHGVVAPLPYDQTVFPKWFSSLFGSEKLDQFEFSLPALSLVHDCPLNFNHENPKEAEQSAYHLLSRAMGFEVDSRKERDEGQISYDKLKEIRAILTMNIAESFALLVDSRLRAHATFMAMHGLAVKKRNFTQDGSLDQKLHTLLEIGDRVTGTKTEVRVNVVGAGHCRDDSKIADQHDSTLVEKHSSAISFQIKMQLLFDSFSDEPSSSLDIQCEASGSLSVSHSARSCVVNLEVDIQQLLSQMRENAAQVVAHVIELTNAYYRPDQNITAESEDLLSLPSASKQIQSGQQAVISPDISSCTSDSTGVPQMLLNEVKVSEASYLSPDQCANILDDVFGDVDLTAVLPANTTVSNCCISDGDYSSRPSKKKKITD